MRSRSLAGALWIASAAILAMPVLAAALAGGATGGGGGGGGGGGSSFSSGGGDGSGGQLGWWGWLIILGIVGLIFFGGSFGAFLKVRKRRARARRMERQARIADLDDGYWDPEVLKARVKECFFPIQSTWGERDVAGSRPFVSDGLLDRHRLQLEGYEAQHRVNRIEDLTFDEVEIVRIHNVADDHEDRFVAYIRCKARDWMEDTRSGKVVNGNRKSATTFEQFWTFTRSPEHGWVLDEIQQYKEGEYHLSEPAVNLDGLGASTAGTSAAAEGPGRPEPASS